MSSSSAQGAAARSPAAAFRELRKTAISLQQLTDELAATPRAQLKRVITDSASLSSSLLDTLQKTQARFADIHRTALGKSKAAPTKALAAPTAMARLREQANQGLKTLVEEGTLVSRSAFQDERTITRQALSKAQQERRLFHVEIEGEKYFPSFFLDSCYDRSKLEAVSKALGDLPGTTKLHFFLNRRGSLAGVTPLEAVAGGDYQKVLNAAVALHAG